MTEPGATDPAARPVRTSRSDTGAASAFARDLRSTPNLITLSRIAITLVAAGLFFAGYERVGMALAVAGGITDYLDGYWARRTGQVTRLGEILDQFCDIFFESLVLYIAIAVFHFLPFWFLTVYLVREFWVASIRRFMAGHQLNIASNFLGKLKTNFVMWGFLPTFLSIERVLPGLEPVVAYVGRGGIALGLIFGLVSGWDYTRQMIVGYDQIAAGRPHRGSILALPLLMPMRRAPPSDRLEFSVCMFLTVPKPERNGYLRRWYRDRVIDCVLRRPGPSWAVHELHSNRS